MLSKSILVRFLLNCLSCKLKENYPSIENLTPGIVVVMNTLEFKTMKYDNNTILAKIIKWEALLRNNNISRICIKKQNWFPLHLDLNSPIFIFSVIFTYCGYSERAVHIAIWMAKDDFKSLVHIQFHTRYFITNPKIVILAYNFLLLVQASFIQ